MKLDDAGIKFISKEEGIRLKAYKCSAGVWTIGIGSTYYPSGAKVKEGDQITLPEVYTIFSNVVREFELTVIRSIKITLNQNQFNALVSLCYNIGVGAFSKSTLVKKINSGESLEIINQWFLVWNKVKGRANLALLQRRKREISLFTK